MNDKHRYYLKALVLTALTWLWILTGIDLVLAVVITWFWGEYMHTYHKLAQGAKPNYEVVE